MELYGGNWWNFKLTTDRHTEGMHTDGIQLLYIVVSQL